MPIFAVLVVTGVAFGMVALAVDVGNIMYERRQLQNGADSTSLALARECADTDVPASDCVPDNPEVEPLLGENASDGLAQYDGRVADAPDGACGRNTGNPFLTDCASNTSDAAFDELEECPPLPDWLRGNTIPYVETYSMTESTESNPTVLPRYFSRLILGGGEDVTVEACARAAWGPPGSYTGSVPVVISACEWMRQTNDGIDYVDEGPIGGNPGYGGAGQPAWPDAAREVVVILHDPLDEDSDCDWNGKDTAGGFGFVDSSGCAATVTTDGWINIDPGASAPSDCRTVLPGLVGTKISLPVFDCLINSHTTPTGPAPSPPPEDVCDPTVRASGGAKSWYHVEGWAQFYLSGYEFPGLTQSSVLPGGHTSCGIPGAKCLYGWFLKGSLDADTIADPGSGSDFGTYTILPAG
jgi:hypothetical protein